MDDILYAKHTAKEVSLCVRYFTGSQGDKTPSLSLALLDRDKKEKKAWCFDGPTITLVSNAVYRDAL